MHVTGSSSDFLRVGTNITHIELDMSCTILGMLAILLIPYEYPHLFTIYIKRNSSHKINARSYTHFNTYYHLKLIIF